jgi:hypothetical protein
VNVAAVVGHDRPNIDGLSLYLFQKEARRPILGHHGETALDKRVLYCWHIAQAHDKISVLVGARLLI